MRILSSPGGGACVVIDCLRYFFPRMINGGIILIHDFHTDGIKKAIKEYSSENPIQVIDLSGTQGMILKH